MKKLITFLCILITMGTMVSTAAEPINKSQMIKVYMKEALDVYNIPGASLAVLKDGEVFFQDNLGVLSDGSPVTSDTSFLIGSLSKPITSLAIMILVEEGKIKLDEPIQTYIPWFTYQTNSSKSITIQNLLEQTSGISESEGLKVTDRAYPNREAIKQAVRALSGIKLTYTPGEKYEYNSANYLLLGAIIEEVTSKPFSEFLKTYVFLTLGMDNTEADYEGAVRKGYLPGFQSWFGKPVLGDGFYDNSGAPYGYIVSSSNDLIKFLKFMLYGGDLLTEQSLNLLKTHSENDISYGFGWFYSDTEKQFFHGGATPHFRAEMFFNPEQDLAAVLVTNKYNVLEDQQVSLIMKGIRSIMYENSTIDLPKQKHTTQWISLGITLLIAVMSIFNLVRLKRKSVMVKKSWIIVGVISIIIAIGLVPVLVYILGAPWHSIYLFAPDLAFLIRCMVTILAINSFLTMIMIGLKRK